jgi:hypothetical protein
MYNFSFIYLFSFLISVSVILVSTTQKIYKIINVFNLQNGSDMTIILKKILNLKYKMSNVNSTIKNGEWNL